MAQETAYQPLVLVNTEHLSRPDWLAYRRKGLGGGGAEHLAVSDSPGPLL